MMILGPKPVFPGGAVVHTSRCPAAAPGFQPPDGRPRPEERRGGHPLRGCLIPFCAFLFLFVTGVVSHGQDASDKIPFSISSAKKTAPSKTAGGSAPGWQTIETRYTVIKYTTFKALKQFERDIDFSPDGSGLGFFSSSKDPAASIPKKMDALYARVAEILDMRRGMKKVNIEIYAGKKELHKAYTRIVGGVCRVRAWYLFSRNTIHINADDVHEGMLAHEMAHAIIDHYFSVRPPRASAEILARYVDAHLFNETRKY